MQTRVEFETIGDRLEAMRKVTNMSKEKVYKFLGTTKNIYPEVRYSKKLMPINWAYKFHEAYGFRIDWIYSGKGEILKKTREIKMPDFIFYSIMFIAMATFAGGALIGGIAFYLFSKDQDEPRIYLA